MAELTQDQKQLVKTTWEIIDKEKEVVGINFFREMFQALPEYLTFFQSYSTTGASAESLLANEKFAKDHIVGNVMKAIGKLVNNIDNPDIIESVLVQLGKNHKKRNVVKPHFENVKVILAKVFKEYLGKEWNKDVEQAWTEFINLVFNTIYKGL
ncbi:neuroglobin-like isoform X3 [Lycorma delicatula]|uniref:neuroglobin-like isoform X2 n=1 Tax=Lycorma delicatula TaxID=130591 RepID=UPI003F512F68